MSQRGKKLEKRGQKRHIESIDSDSEKKSSNLDSQTRIIGMIEGQNKINKEMMETMRMMREEMKKMSDEQVEIKNEIKRIMDKKEEMKREFNEKLGFLNRKLDSKATNNRIKENDEDSDEESGEDDQKLWNEKVADALNSLKVDVEIMKTRQHNQNKQVEEISGMVNILRKKNIIGNIVRVRTLTGKTSVIEIDLSETVFELKKKIEEVDGVPLNLQRILFAGKQLNDEKTLEECKLFNGDIVNMVLRLLGGPPYYSDSD